MPNQRDFVDKTQREVVEILQNSFGFNKYQAKAYVAVLSGHIRPKEVARKAAIPLTRVYDVLLGLCEMGLIQKVGERYVPNTPTHALRALLDFERASFEKNFEEKTKALNRVQGLVKKFGRSEAMESEAAIIRGVGPVVVKLYEMADNAQTFVFAVRKAVKLKEQFKNVVEKLQTKKFVFVLHPSVALTEGDKVFFNSIRADVYVSEAVLLDVLVTDGGEALIGLPLDDEPVVVWVKDPGFSSSLMRSLLELKNG